MKRDRKVVIREKTKRKIGNEKITSGGVNIRTSGE